ncbi:MAG: hemolysin family protein [bacterium]|nr:hemolysin family protein [bacterium]
MVELLAVVIGVVLISAMCSLFEAVLYSVPISHIESLAQSGKKAGHTLRKMRANVDRPISAILSLNTIANTGGASLAGIIAGKIVGKDSIEEYLFSAGFTLVILLFAEVIPKTIGVVYARPVSTYIAQPLQLLVWLFAPLITLCRFATRLVASSQPSQDISNEEFISLARMGHQSGTLDPTEAGVIQNILSLKSKTAAQVMTPRTVVFSLDESLTLDECRNQKGFWAHSRIPVYSDGFEDIIGIVLRRDMLAALTNDDDHRTLSQLMRPVHFVPETHSLDRILQLFLERRQHLFIVIDEYGGLSGVLTLEDVLEEILGKEIVDESDQVADMRELARVRRQQTSGG